MCVGALLQFILAQFELDYLKFLRYEGTGRSLSLKLIQQLRQQSAESQQTTTAENRTTNTAKLAAGESSVRCLQGEYSCHLSDHFGRCCLQLAVSTKSPFTSPSATLRQTLWKNG